MFVSINAGTSLARDMETGFLNRLALTPLRSEAMLVGQLGGAFVLACVQAVVYLLVGLATGVGFASGAGGVVVLLALSLSISFAFACLGGLLALRFGSGEAIQGIFPLLFVTLFLSSSSLPRNLIKVEWFRDIATYNPISYLIEGMRSLVISGLERAGAGARVRLLLRAGADLARARATRDELEAGTQHEALPLRRARGRLALDPQHGRQPGDHRALGDLPAVLPGGLRGRALAHQRCAELRLQAGLHVLPVHLRLPSVGRLRRRLHGLRRRARLPVGLRAQAAAVARRGAAASSPAMPSARSCAG